LNRFFVPLAEGGKKKKEGKEKKREADSSLPAPFTSGVHPFNNAIERYERRISDEGRGGREGGERKSPRPSAISKTAVHSHGPERGRKGEKKGGKEEWCNTS